MSNTTSITVIGAGGNIGSHLVPHLARLRGVQQVTLVDPDSYRPHNLYGQDIAASDIGQPKVRVQARRLKRIRPVLRVRAIASRVEAVPLGQLRADVVLACLDTRAARQWVNEAARHLGVPWIDAGVDGAGLIARVSVFPADGSAACLECGWGPSDYEALEPVYACAGSVENAPTNAPSSLGALAASLQAIECQKLLDGGPAPEAMQTFLDMRAPAHYVTRLPRNPACRLADHASWRIRPAAARTLQGVFMAAEAAGLGEAHALRAGRAFSRQLRCAGCGNTQPGLLLRDAAARTCERCGDALVAAALDLEWELGRASVPASDLRRSLRRLGFRSGDIVSVACERGGIHLEIGATA